MVELTENEAIVLDVIARGNGYFGPGDFFWNFRALGAETELDRRSVRAACRSLTNHGLATFAAGLMDDDGQPAGSGYSATRAGIDFGGTQTEER